MWGADRCCGGDPCGDGRLPLNEGTETALPSGTARGEASVPLAGREGLEGGTIRQGRLGGGRRGGAAVEGRCGAGE